MSPFDLDNGCIRLRVHPPGPGGRYQGTRFDWSGMISDLVHEGHNFYPRWFARVDPGIRDYVHEDAGLAVSPCTAATGPAEEFCTGESALGFDEAAPGAGFIKIGVGLLRRPDAQPYDCLRPYALLSGGRWRTEAGEASVSMTQDLADPHSGFGYAYTKRVILVPGLPQLRIEHRLVNTGGRGIATSVYNHNFLCLDGRPAGPGLTVLLPFPIRLGADSSPGPASVGPDSIGIRRDLVRGDCIMLYIGGFGPSAADHDLRIENAPAGYGVRTRGDRPLSRLKLWAIRGPACIEPYVDLDIPPGAEASWSVTYDYYRLPGR